MLVLSRKVDEEVVIGPGTPGEVGVVVLAIRGDQVRLGFSAPEHVVVHRREVADKIAAKKGRV